VKVSSIENNLVYIKRKFKLLNLESDDQSTKYIDHYHFTVWPDLSVRIINLDLIN